VASAGVDGSKVSTAMATYYSRGFPVRGCVAAQRDVLAG
jgi:hypothetical protein